MCSFLAQLLAGHKILTQVLLPWLNFKSWQTFAQCLQHAASGKMDHKVSPSSALRNFISYTCVNSCLWLRWELIKGLFLICIFTVTRCIGKEKNVCLLSERHGLFYQVGWNFCCQGKQRTFSYSYSSHSFLRTSQPINHIGQQTSTTGKTWNKMLPKAPIIKVILLSWLQRR